MNIKEVVVSVVETIVKVVLAVILVMFVYKKAVWAYDYGYRVFAEEPMTTGDGRIISISVEPGDSAKKIGENLEEKGLIRDANLFFIQELLSEYHGLLNPGIYDLNTSMTSDEMMAVMSAEPKTEEEAGASTDNVPVDGTDTGNEGNEEGADGVNDTQSTEGAEDAGETGGPEAGDAGQ